MLEALSNISKNQIESFILMCEESRGDPYLAEIKFNHQGFNQIKQLLLEFSLIVEQQNQIELLNGLTKNNISDLLLKKMFVSNNEIGIQLVNYLKKFQKNKQNGYEYLPKNSFVNPSDQIIRNFLIDFQVIYNKGTKFHVFEHQLTLFEDFFKKSSMSPEALKREQENNLKLGQEAETYVLDFERDRLSEYPELALKIDYIAEKDVSAEYDILSWEIDPFGTERYIEVKAVSEKKDFEFHWTKNEIETAKNFKNQYFIYLLPVITGTEKTFDLENLIIIQNPFKNVFNSEKWVKEPDGYIVSLNEK